MLQIVFIILNKTEIKLNTSLSTIITKAKTGVKIKLNRNIEKTPFNQKMTWAYKINKSPI